MVLSIDYHPMRSMKNFEDGNYQRGNSPASSSIVLISNSTSGSIEIRRVRLKHFYKAQIMMSSENPLAIIEQHFEYIAVIDFEATCDQNQGNNFLHEIIEFPVVLIHVPKRAIVRVQRVKLEKHLEKCFLFRSTAFNRIVDRF